VNEAAPKRRRPTSTTALRMLERLAEARAGLGVHELAAGVGLDSGQCHRLLRFLADDGWVAQSRPKGPYRITGKVLNLAGRMLRHIDLREIAAPTLHRLHDLTQETVGLVEVRGDALICIDRIVSRQPVTVGTQIGDRIPLNGTATGTAVQAALIRNGADIARTPLSPMPATTDDVRLAARRGFAIDDRSYRPEIRAAAAAIVDLENAPVGAIFIAAPASRTSVQRIEEIGRLVASEVSGISEELGYGGSDGS
jgi:DNA-binding IclR family transcriptional regulator